MEVTLTYPLWTLLFLAVLYVGLIGLYLCHVASTSENGKIGRWVNDHYAGKAALVELKERAEP